MNNASHFQMLVFKIFLVAFSLLIKINLVICENSENDLHFFEQNQVKSKMTKFYL